MEKINMVKGQNFNYISKQILGIPQEIIEAYQTILFYYGYLRFNGWEFEVIKDIVDFPPFSIE